MTQNDCGEYLEKHSDDDATSDNSNCCVCCGKEILLDEGVPSCEEDIDMFYRCRGCDFVTCDDCFMPCPKECPKECSEEPERDCFLCPNCIAEDTVTCFKCDRHMCRCEYGFNNMWEINKCIKCGVNDLCHICYDANRACVNCILDNASKPVL